MITTNINQTAKIYLDIWQMFEQLQGWIKTDINYPPGDTLDFRNISFIYHNLLASYQVNFKNNPLIIQ